MEGVARFLPLHLHPLVVHFPIAILFVAFAVDAAAFWRQDLVLERMGFLLLWMGLAAVVGAIAAGVLAEQEVLVRGSVTALLAAHRRDGLLTGLLVAATVALRWRARTQWLRQHPSREVTLKDSQSRMTGTTRAVWLATGGLWIATLSMLGVTARLGGSMVYEHGVGVAMSTAGPVARSSQPSSGAGGTAFGAPGRRGTGGAEELWRASCSRCHGDLPPFDRATVSQVGPDALARFISEYMPPGDPVGPHQARLLVHYFDTLSLP
jgi:uncharacterized membrane protein